MKRSSASSSTEQSASAHDPDFLDLPVDPDFISLPPQVSLEIMSRNIKMFRTSFPNSLPTEEERLRAKVDVEFKFLD